MDDDPRPGRVSSASTCSNVTEIEQLISEEPRTSLRVIAQKLGIGKDTVHNILKTQFGMRKVCYSWIPHLLFTDNKLARVQCAKDMVRQFENNSLQDCCKFWCTEDETWGLFDTPNTKLQNKAWQKSDQPRLTVVKPAPTNRKALLLVAFTADKKIAIEVAKPKETFDSERYIEFVRRTGDKWRVLRTNPTKLSSLWW